MCVHRTFPAGGPTCPLVTSRDPGETREGVGSGSSRIRPPRLSLGRHRFLTPCPQIGSGSGTPRRSSGRCHPSLAEPLSGTFGHGLPLLLRETALAAAQAATVGGAGTVVRPRLVGVC